MMLYEWFISQKFFYSHREKAFIRNISVISIITVMLSVSVPIIVLSIMNGLHTNIGEKIISLQFDLRITPTIPDIPNYQEMVDYLEQTYPDSIQCAIPYFHSVGLIRRAGYFDVENSGSKSYNVHIWGLRDEDLEKNTPFKTNFQPVKIGEEMDGSTIQDPDASIDLKEDNQVYFGYALVRYLGLFQAGQKVEILLPTGDIMADAALEFKPFRLKSSYSAGFAEYDAHCVIVPFEAQKAHFGRENYATGIGIHLKNSITPDWFAQELQKDKNLSHLFETSYQDYDRDLNSKSKPINVVNTREEGVFMDFFREKRTIFYVLLLMVVAAFITIYMTLHVIVLDKRREIGILKSFGTTATNIQRIFVFEGLAIGTIGTFLGVALSMLVCISMDEIVTVVEWIVTHVNLYILGLKGAEAEFHIMPTKIFYLNTFPVKIRWDDVLMQTTGAIFVALLASYLSSKRASLQKPITVLRMRG